MVRGAGGRAEWCGREGGAGVELRVGRGGLRGGEVSAGGRAGGAVLEVGSKAGLVGRGLAGTQLGGGDWEVVRRGRGEGRSLGRER